MEAPGFTWLVTAEAAAYGRVTDRDHFADVAPYGDGARSFGEWKLVEVNEAALWAYRTAREIKTVLLDKNGKPTRRYVGGSVTVNRDVQLLRRAFNWALAAMPGDVHVSPFKAGKPPKGLVSRESSRSRRLQEGEAERLLAACGASLRPLVEATLETGCRLGELLGLQWADVSLRDVRPEPRLPAAKTKTRKAHGADLGAAAPNPRDAPSRGGRQRASARRLRLRPSRDRRTHHDDQDRLAAGDATLQDQRSAFPRFAPRGCLQVARCRHQAQRRIETARPHDQPNKRPRIWPACSARSMTRSSNSISIERVCKNLQVKAGKATRTGQTCL